MSKETDYITYLETKVCDHDNRIKELEAVLMLILFSEANKLDRDLIYLLISQQVYKTMPFSKELIDTYKQMVIDYKGQI